MIEYPKINTIFKRDPATNNKTLLMGEYSLPEFGYLANNEWMFTEKVDGTNIRVIFDGKRVRFGGKTENASIPAKLITRLEELFPADLFSASFPDLGDTSVVCLYGAGIGKGESYRPTQDFVLFDVLVDGWWLKRHNVEDVACKMGLNVVPIVGRGTLAVMIELVKNKAFNSRWDGATPEGIVARPTTELRTRSGDRIITKLKHKDFR